MQINNNQLLRFTTAGSVDNGKSTLIGRLLYDSKSIFEDQLEAVAETSKRKGYGEVDLALFTDGLRDEREQGITIDVAYRYFTTPKRKFIIADTPGHVQYTRNMVTGASTANAALILIDARDGVVEQTRRHSFIASLLNIPHLIVCVNKMDLVGFSEEVYREIVEEFEELSSKLLIKDIRYIPMSALKGDNVVDGSKNMDWYHEGTLLNILETLHISSDINKIDARFPVQTVIRNQGSGSADYRGYAGRISSGIYRNGDEVVILPSGLNSRIRSIMVGANPVEEAFAPMSIVMDLEDDIDVSRRDMIVKKNNQPQQVQEFDVMLCWLNNETGIRGKKYIVVHTTNEQRAMITEVIYKVDVNSFERITGDDSLNRNDIARVNIKSAKPLMLDSYRENRITGAIILIDAATNETVAAGMVV